MAILKHAESVRSLNQDRTNFFHNLFQLSQLFLEQIGVGPNHMGRDNQKTVIDAAVEFVPDLSNEEELETELSVLSDKKARNINSIFERQKHELLNQLDNLREELRKYKANESTMSNESSPTNESSPPNEPMPTIEPPPSNRGRKRGGSDNLDNDRAEIKKARGMARLECILSLPGRHPDTSKLTESARNFMNTAVFPIMKCLEMHHHNDKLQFLQKWPLTKGFTRFRTKQCNCKGSLCGIS
jgi:hypothetical protein